MRQHRDNPAISIMALNSDCFPDFSKRDLEYFKFIDVRHKDYADWSDPAYFRIRKDKPQKSALHTALAVLTKSAAALLISRHLKTVPAYWRVVAFPYVEQTE